MPGVLFDSTETEGSDHRKNHTFWKFALGEFVLVLLGILIALQVDNWNEERKEKRLERVLLSEMLTDLNGDLADIDFNMNALRHYQNANRVVLEYLNSNLPWHDSLGYYFAQLLGASLFDINTSAYESMKSIGIDLVRNDTLRQRITALYSVRYNHVISNQDVLFTFVFDHLYPSLKENLQTINMRMMAVPVSLDELRHNISFREDLKMAIFTYRLSLLIYEEARESLTQLISNIEQELGQEPGDSKL